MRNEQSASYAAQAVGYLTGRPGACLVVSGPGVVHALAGLANAQQNGWPMILHRRRLGVVAQNGMGAFQEERQVLIATPFCKYAHAVEHVHRIPFYVELAVRNSHLRPARRHLSRHAGRHHHRQGRRGRRCARAGALRRTRRARQAMPEDVERGAGRAASRRSGRSSSSARAWPTSRAEDEVRAFIERTQLPFLASPMGKGVMPDDHPLSVGAARSHALQNADVVFLMGARLNWIMHFGLPPRFNKNVRVIQLDIAPEAIGQNVPAEVALVGDGKAIVGQLNKALEKRRVGLSRRTRPGTRRIAEKTAANAKQIAADDRRRRRRRRTTTARCRTSAAWMPRERDHHRRGREHDGHRPHPAAELRAAARASTPAATARWASAWASSIAAAVVHPDKPIVSVSGDSAFGFSGMEMETVCRYKLPVKIVVLNNGGIGRGARRASRTTRCRTCGRTR